MNTRKQTYPLPLRRRGDVFGNDTAGALRALLDAVQRMDTDYVFTHKVSPTTELEYGRAITRALDALDELDGRL